MLSVKFQYLKGYIMNIGVIKWKLFSSLKIYKMLLKMDVLNHQNLQVLQIGLQHINSSTKKAYREMPRHFDISSKVLVSQFFPEFLVSQKAKIAWKIL